MEIASDEELSIRTNMPRFESQSITLRIEHIAGKGNYLAIDDLIMEQIELIDSP